MHIESLEFVIVNLTWKKKVFADMIKWRILKWRHNPGFIRVGSKSNDKCPYNRKTEEIGKRSRKDTWIGERQYEDKGTLWNDEATGQEKPWNPAAVRSWKKPLSSSLESEALQDWGLPACRSMRINFFWFKAQGL